MGIGVEDGTRLREGLQGSRVPEAQPPHALLVAVTKESEDTQRSDPE